MENKVVARFRDGRVVKGTTINFSPARDRFHLTAEGKTVEIQVVALKALFFVKSHAGDKTYREKKEFDGSRNLGRKIRCEFPDGETIAGFTQGYDPARPGFFLVPVDPKANNERIFIVSSSVRAVRFDR